VDQNTAYNRLISHVSPPDSKEKSKLSGRRSKLKSKFKKWAQGEKSTDEEKRLYRQIIKCLDESKKIPKAVFHFEKIEGKISRYNDKKKAVEELEKLQDELIESGVNCAGYTVHTIEKLFKIPEESDVEMNVKEQVRLYTDYHNQYFSAFPIFLVAEHHDELREHPHLYHNGISPDGQLYADREIER